jgi:ribosomal protein L37AE/L43A
MKKLRKVSKCSKCSPKVAGAIFDCVGDFWVCRNCDNKVKVPARSTKKSQKEIEEKIRKIVSLANDAKNVIDQKIINVEAREGRVSNALESIMDVGVSILISELGE